MTVKVIEVTCDSGLYSIHPTELIERLKKLVEELERAQNQGYKLESNPFQEHPVCVHDLTFRFVLDFNSMPVEALREACKLGFRPEILWQDVEVLGLSTRARNALSKAGIFQIHTLVRRSYNDMMRLMHLGKRSVEEIHGKLQQFGLDFEMKLPKEVEELLPPLPLR
jgi:DNA-directed RNA polymerase alpha subunit